MITQKEIAKPPKPQHIEYDVKKVIPDVCMREEIKEASAGDIITLVGMKETITGDTLCDESNPIILESIHVPEPVISIAVEPKTKADIEKMSLGLQALAKEDPSFRVSVDEESGQTILAGVGELHLEILVDRLWFRSNRLGF